MHHHVLHVQTVIVHVEMAAETAEMVEETEETVVVIVETEEMAIEATEEIPDTNSSTLYKFPKTPSEQFGGVFLFAHSQL
jgi:hypothetical protein